MLQAVEAEYYLEHLEKCNFNVFSRLVNTNSYIQLPMRLFKSARKQQFTYNSYSSPAKKE